MSFQFETERFIVRDIREDDVPILVKQYAEPEARENILDHQADEDRNTKGFKNYIEWLAYPKRDFFFYSVVRKADKALLGSCSMHKVMAESFETAIGWHFGHAFRGHGYATEAARGLLYIGFALNQVNEIRADCFVGNRASIRIFEKIGMRPRFNHELFNLIRGWSYGEHKPTVRYVISRREWKARQEKIEQ